jgi:hypothetical protein
MWRVAEEEMTVRPIPFIEPPVQFIKLPTVTTLLPPISPPLNVNTEGATVPVPSKAAAQPEMTIVFVKR